MEEQRNIAKEVFDALEEVAKKTADTQFFRKYRPNYYDDVIQEMVMAGWWWLEEDGHDPDAIEENLRKVMNNAGQNYIRAEKQQEKIKKKVQSALESGETTSDFQEAVNEVLGDIELSTLQKQVLQALYACDGNMQEAAKLLNVRVKSVYNASQAVKKKLVLAGKADASVLQE